MAISQAVKITEPEIDYDDPRFNQGVQHVVDLLAKTLGATDWVAGDGSEDYDCDLEQTLLNILSAKGLYDKDSGQFGAAQHLLARIKKSSKYSYQAPKGGWFDVRVVPDMGYGLRGNNNNYRFSDVVFGIRLENGTIAELK